MLGDNIRKYRKLNNMSQDDLAEKLNVTRQSISLWENGQTQPTIENIIAIAEVFGVATDDILKTKTTIENDDNTVDNALPNALYPIEFSINAVEDWADFTDQATGEIVNKQ